MMFIPLIQWTLDVQGYLQHLWDNVFQKREVSRSSSAWGGRSLTCTTYHCHSLLLERYCLEGKSFVLAVRWGVFLFPYCFCSIFVPGKPVVHVVQVWFGVSPPVLSGAQQFQSDIYDNTFGSLWQIDLWKPLAAFCDCLTPWAPSDSKVLSSHEMT